MPAQTYPDYRVSDPDPAAQLALMQWLTCHGHEVVDRLCMRPHWRAPEIAAAQRATEAAYDRLAELLTLSDVGVYLQACADLGQPVQLFPVDTAATEALLARIVEVRAVNARQVAAYLAPWRPCALPPRDLLDDVDCSWYSPVFAATGQGDRRVVGLVDMRIGFYDSELATMPLEHITPATDPADLAPFAALGDRREVFCLVRSTIPDPCAVLREIHVLRAYLPDSVWVVVSHDAQYRTVFEDHDIFFVTPAA